MLLNDLLGRRNHVIALPKFDQTQPFQRPDDVLRPNARPVRDVFDAQAALGRLVQRLQDHPCPIASVAHGAQIAQRALRRADPAFLPRQLIRKVNKEAPVPLPLVRWQGQDARKIVPLGRLLLLAKVSDNMMPVLVDLAQHVEQERIHVIIERLVVQEQLGQQTQVLTVNLGLPAIHLKHGDLRVGVRRPVKLARSRRGPVNLVPRGAAQRQLGHVPQQRLLLAKILERILADK
mmetsp:Transcript_9408/g.25476  ORF Transcript_9408/g.25476 Transcript_9408/m.25476 type:complete len:234 (+) Transcript_9408:1227-1928(+)